MSPSLRGADVHHHAEVPGDHDEAQRLRREIEGYRAEYEELGLLSAGHEMPAHALTPAGAGGGVTEDDGTFSFVVEVPHSYLRTGWTDLFGSRPEPRCGVAVLRIEREGREPVLLDVPAGTWTEHDDEGPLWATWNLGVIEVPAPRD